MYSEATAGLFRANPEAASPNSPRFVDPTTPGTPGQDNGTLTIVAASIIQGIQYIGKSGVTAYIPLANYQYPDGAMENTEIRLADGVAAFQKALRTVVEMHEVDPVITVTDAVPGSWVVRHVGSGTIDFVVVSGVTQQLARTAL